MWTTAFSVLAFLATICCAGKLPREVTFGDCVDFKTDPAFDAAAFSTQKWFEISKTYNTFEGNSDCVEQTFVLDAAAKKFTTSFALRFENGTSGILQGAINYTVNSNETLLDAIYPGEEATKFSFDVLGTNAKSYAVVYSCYQVSNGTLPVKDERIWVLSRSPTLLEEDEEAVYEALIYEGTSLGSDLYETNQNNCL